MSDNRKAQNIIHDMFEAYKHSSDYKDSSRIEIACRKSELESHLDKMWSIYMRGNVSQIVEYNKQLDSIKSTGCKVLRNSKGIHKIIIGG